MAITNVVFKDPSTSTRLEGETFDVPLTFLNGDTPEDPAHFYYQVTNVQNGEIVVAMAKQATTSASYTLAIPAEATKTVTPEISAETRELLIVGPSKNTLAIMEFRVRPILNLSVGQTFPS